MPQSNDIQVVASNATGKLTYILMQWTCISDNSETVLFAVEKTENACYRDEVAVLRLGLRSLPHQVVLLTRQKPGKCLQRTLSEQSHHRHLPSFSELGTDPAFGIQQLPVSFLPLLDHDAPCHRTDRRVAACCRLPSQCHLRMSSSGNALAEID